MKARRKSLVGTLASNSYAGMAWMPMQIAAGLCRVGLDDYYFETTSNWPYDPKRQQRLATRITPRLMWPAVRKVLACKTAAHRAAAIRTASGSFAASQAQDLLAHADNERNATFVRC